jgi:hypothetical protein
MPRVLLLDERILADGRHARTFASLAGERIAIRDDDGTAGELSIGAVDHVLRHYGRPLDPAVTLAAPAADDALALPGGYRLRRLRHHALVDAEARDYLVWERPDGEPLCVIARMVTAALRYLVLRLTAEHPQESET